MKNQFRILLKITGVLFCLVLLAIAGLRIWITTDHAQRMIQREINALIPGEITWGDVDLFLIRGSISVENPVLKGPSGETLIEIGRIYANISWASISGNGISLDNAEIIMPKVWLSTENYENLNLLKAFPDDESGDSDSGSEDQFFNVKIKKGHLSDGFFSYRNYGDKKDLTEGYVTVKGIELNLRNGDLLDESVRASIKTGSSDIDIEGIKTHISNLLLKGSLDKGALKESSLIVNSTMGDFHVSGGVDALFTLPRLDLNATADTSLDGIRELFQLTEDLSGPLSFSLAVKGSVDDPTADLKADLGQSSISGIDVGSARLNCSLKERGLTIHSFDLNHAMGNVAATGDINLKEAFPEGFIADAYNVEAMSYSLAIKQTGMDLENVAGPEAGVKGIIRSTLSLEGKGISTESLSVSGNLNLSAETFSVEDSVAPINFDLSTTLLFEKTILGVEQLAITNSETEITGNGAIDFSKETILADLKLMSSAYEATGLFPGVDVRSGNLILSTELNGNLTQPEISARLVGDHVVVYGIPVGTIDVKASLDDSGMVVFEGESSKEGGDILKTSGNIHVFQNGFNVYPGIPADVSVDFKQVDISEFMKSKPVSGRISGKATYRGEINNPEIILSLSGKKLGIGTHHKGQLNTSLKLKNGYLHIDKADIRNGKSLLVLSGKTHLMNPENGDMLDDPELDLTISGTPLYLEDFIPDIKGRLSITGQIKGRVNHPDGFLKLTGANIDTGYQSITDASIGLTLDGKRINVDRCRLSVAPGESVDAIGWISPNDMTYDLNIMSSGISLKSIDMIKEAAPDPGTLKLAFSGKGSFESPSLDGTLTLTNLSTPDKQFEDLRLQINLKENNMAIRGNPGFDVDAKINMDSLVFSADAVFERTSFKPVFEFLGKGELGGFITGRVEADGVLDTLKSLNVSTEITECVLKQNEVELIRSGRIHASLKNKIVSVPGITLALYDQGYLKINGEGTVDGPVSFFAKGNIPVEVFRIYAEEYPDLEGDVDISASVKGTAVRPEIRGEVTLVDIGMTLPDLMQKLHGVNGRIEFTPNTINLDHIRGKLDTGTFDLSGSLGMKIFQPESIDATLQVSSLPVSLPETLDVLVNSRVSIKGTAESSRISGDLLIVEGRYYKDVSLNLIENVGRRTREHDPVQRHITLPLLNNPELNINIRHRSPFDVDNNMAVMSLRPDLYIHGTMKNPLVSGRAEVDYGAITYQGKDFQVTKGVVDFINPYKIEPTVDIKGQVEVRSWMIYLEVSGTPDNLEFKLTSDPHEGDWNILSLLAFGKTTEELAQGGSGATVSTRQILADMVSKTLQENIKGATGVDSIEMEYVEGTEEGAKDDIKVTVGKELSERVTLKYGVETKDGVTVQSAITEYRFLENLLMNAFQDTEGDFGGELVFRLEFR